MRRVLAPTVLPAIAIVLYGAIAAMSLIRVADLSQAALFTDPASLAWALLMTLVSGALLIAVIRWSPSDRAHPLLLAVVFATLIGLRVAALVTLPAPVTADWLRYHEIALDIASNGPRFDVVPTGFPVVLALVYGVFGTDPVKGQVLQVVVAAATGILLYALTRRIWNDRVGLVAMLLYAIAPSQILMGTVLASEPLYTLLVVALAATVILWPGLAGAIAAGALLGLSQYVRATSLAFLPAVVFMAWWLDARKRALTRAALLVGCFALVLLPVLLWNLTTLGTPSLSTSRVQNFSLMVGFNQASRGAWNLEDYQLVGSEYGTKRSEAIAGRVAMDRLTSDPIGAALLMVQKFEKWGDEDYASYWAIGAAGSSGTLRNATSLVSHLWWTGVTLLVFVGVMTRRLVDPLTLLTTLLVVTMTLLHAVLEAQGRYHNYVTPLFAAMAAATLCAGIRWRAQDSASRTASASESGQRHAPA